MSGEKQSACSSRLCDKAASGQSPLTGLSLCPEHLDRDIKKVKDQQVRLVDRLKTLVDSADRQQLRLEQQMLDAEIQEMQDMFDAVQEKLQQWRDRAVSRVQAVHDSVARRLRDSAEAEECSNEVSLACDAGDMRKVMELTASTESWLDEACERATEFERVRSELHDRQSRQIKRNHIRCVGDVAAGVQQLQFDIDRHMSDMMQQCWLYEEEASAMSTLPVRESMAIVCDFETEPIHLACCTDTRGFLADSSGRALNVESSSSSLVPLPQPCIFVAFGKNCADHLAVTSLDGAVRLKWQCDLDWTKWISGLHCDSKRQLIFVAQFATVTVADLSGRVTRVISGDSLKRPVERITAIAGNSDKVFLLDLALGNVLSVSKDTWQLESVINVSALQSGKLDELAVHGSKLLLLDWKAGLLHKVCSVTGQLIATYPDCASEIKSFSIPGQSAVDSRGLVFVTDDSSRVVRVLSTSGTVLQTLALGSGEIALSADKGGDGVTVIHRSGLTVVEDGNTARCLVVADDRQNRLVLFRLT